MSKRVIIVHGWDGYPEEGWFPWLKKELESRSFEVLIPQLPDPENPRIFNWVPKLAQTVGMPDEHTYFVGHSMGCQTIARYLETLPEGTQIGGAIFVAGFLKRLTGLEDDPGVKETAQHWLTTQIDLQKIKTHLPKSVAIFSDNDPFVPLDNQEEFKVLGSKIITLHAQGHFSGPRDGKTELLVVLEELLKL